MRVTYLIHHIIISPSECHAGSTFDDTIHMQFIVACRRRSLTEGSTATCADERYTHTHKMYRYVYVVHVLRLYDINGKLGNRGVRSQIR